MLEKIKKYGPWVLVAAIVLVVIYLVYTWWKKKDDNTTVVVDDRGNPVEFSSTEMAEANAIAKRVNDDLNSGWVLGYNFFSGTEFGIDTGLRDLNAYKMLAQMSDALFAKTAQTYFEKYGSHIAADIRSESSLNNDYVTAILAKADRLKIQ